MRILTGRPGSGKSSCAMMLACDVADSGVYNVFLVELSGLDVDQSIYEIIEDYLENRAPLYGSFPSGHPLKKLKDEDFKPLLLIFDGLDEVARPEGDVRNRSRTFLENLCEYLVDAHTAEPEVKVKALVLARQQVAEQAALEARVSSGAILFMAPLGVLHETTFDRFGEREQHISDPEDLCRKDQRRDFWKKLARSLPDCPADPPDSLFRDELADLTGEPLLLRLLILSGQASHFLHHRGEIRNRIYEEIFRDVSRREYQRTRSSTKASLIGEEHLFTLMECLGLAAWINGGRTGTTAHFEALRDEFYTPEKITGFKGVEYASLENVALKFYTQVGPRYQPGYEFVHRSFGEYLTARALVAAGAKMQSGTSSDHDHDLFAERWLALTGPQPLTREILEFMIGEACMRVMPSGTGEPEYTVARDQLMHLTQFAARILKRGFPAHRDRGLDVLDTKDWRGRETAQRNAEESLFALIHAWTHAAYPEHLIRAEEGSGWLPGAVEIEWPHPSALLALFHRLMVPNSISKGSVASKLFSQFRLSGLHLSRAAMTDADLFGADLSRADLCGADLRGANLNGATLKASILDKTDLRLANLTDADLDSASLIGADLNETDLRDANLRSADLRSADLKNAILTGTILVDAKMCGANLAGADLSGADLCNADLTSAVLSDADLSGSNLRDAVLCNADLSGANLKSFTELGVHAARDSSMIDDSTRPIHVTQRQIDSARGDRATKIAEGLSRPAHWQ